MTIRALLSFCLKLALLRPKILHIMVSRSRLGFLKDFVLMNLAHLAGVKTIVHVRGGDLQRFYTSCGPVLRRLIRFTYRRVDCAIALGPSLRGQFRGLVLERKVRTVLNCYNDSGISSTSPRAQERPSDMLRVLFLSNVLPSKGIFDALKGVALAREQGVSLQFTFVGQFLDFDIALTRNPYQKAYNLDARSLEKKFWDCVNKLNLKSLTRVLGVVLREEKWKLLESSDILLLPIYNPNEGQPLTVIEAMRAGCVIVSTTCGGLCDLVKDGITGTVVRPHCPADIANALADFWRNRDQMLQMSCRNQKKTLERHNPVVHARQINNIYRSLLRSNGRKHCHFECEE